MEMLLEEYILAALTHGNATLNGDHTTANREYGKLTRIYRQLEKDHALAETFLAKLFPHTNASVRLWAAAHALGLNIRTETAAGILQKISEDHSIGIVRLDADMTLKEWRQKGWLRF